MDPASPLAPRAERLGRLFRDPLDVLVVGGGITGIGVALDLACRGLSVAIVEQDDWAARTSSASSRLIHGGLRYLEQGELALVRESCLERGLLLSNAAGMVWPERFLFPLHRPGPVPRWKLLAGLFLYSALAFPRALGLPRAAGRDALARAIPGLRGEGLVGGGSYLDAATDDARLALAALRTAAERGALALSRMEVTGVEGGSTGAEVRLVDRLAGEHGVVRPRAVVLAAGPFTDRLRGLAGLRGRWVAPTRGSHVTVPRARLPTDGAVILPSAVDGRILFLIPWPRYTVIGTTDVDASPDAAPLATRAEVRYLLASANHLVPAAGLTEDDVVASWAGLRPLLAADESNPSARSREERVERDGALYTIAGGKLTGFRAMAEKLGARIARDLDTGNAHARSPTRAVRLHGALDRPEERPAWSSLGADGRPPVCDVRAAAWRVRYAGLAPAVAATCAGDPGGEELLAPDVLAGEVRWAVERDDCLDGVDFCFRRTDLGLEPRPTAEAALPAVLARLASHLGWDDARRAEEEARLRSVIAARHAWRHEGTDA